MHFKDRTISDGLIKAFNFLSLFFLFLSFAQKWCRCDKYLLMCFFFFFLFYCYGSWRYFLLSLAKRIFVETFSSPCPLRCQKYKRRKKKRKGNKEEKREKSLFVVLLSHLDFSLLYIYFFHVEFHILRPLIPGQK